MRLDLPVLQRILFAVMIYVVASTLVPSVLRFITEKKMLVTIIIFTNEINLSLFYSLYPNHTSWGFTILENVHTSHEW